MHSELEYDSSLEGLSPMQIIHTESYLKQKREQEKYAWNILMNSGYFSSLEGLCPIQRIHTESYLKQKREQEDISNKNNESAKQKLDIAELQRFKDAKVCSQREYMLMYTMMTTKDDNPSDESSNTLLIRYNQQQQNDDMKLICSMNCSICHDGGCIRNRCIHLTQPDCIKTCIELNKYLLEHKMWKPEPQNKKESMHKSAYKNILTTYKNFNKWHRSCKNVGECRSSIYLNYLKTGEICKCEYNPKERTCYGDGCKRDKIHSQYCEYYRCKSCHYYPSDEDSDD